MVVRLTAAAVVAGRFARGRRLRTPLAPGAPALPGTVSVVVPARDEERRLAGCLGPLRSEPVDEVIVVDDESSDRTAEVARSFGASVVRGVPRPAGWAGKAWALEQGLRAARGDWVVFLDADVRPRRGLIRALVEAASGVDLLSVGPRFVCETFGERLLHPSFLASIVYRVGPADVPGLRRVVANGQCMVARRSALVRAGGWGRVRSYMTDDVALAQALVREDGWRLRFADGADVLEVRMYESARETWHGWGRSIIDPDVNTRPGLVADLAVLWLAMALPLPRLALGRGDALDVLLLAQRVALLGALQRAYRPRGLAFWLSPLADVPVALRLTWSVLRPPRTWRGRTYA
ncbi:MAG TPA: glycosyltransferase family 2 protein [Solirubrobacteraceae bacterium]|jgi:dolichol-phosphate mannosyltransferase|nr:glycosyltransferase family 2 protein [Solirubrobacteraceae bacterium]